MDSDCDKIINGKHKRRRFISRRDDLMVEDAFSRELARQGDEGRMMRLLYLQESMITYCKRVQDEPLHP